MSKLWIEIDYSIDGEMREDQIIRAAYKLIEHSIILSEQFDDGDKYALTINSVSVSLDKPK